VGKNLKEEVDLHNQQVIEAQKALDQKKKESEKYLLVYGKGLPRDKEGLKARALSMSQFGGTFIWEMGRILILLKALCTGPGEWDETLRELRMSRRTAGRFQDAVTKIPESKLKQLGSKMEAWDLLGAPADYEEEFLEKAENDELTPEDFARKSPTDIKKLLSKIEKLEQENREHATRNTELQAQVDAIKLGTIDEQKIREWLSRWQVDWLGGRNLVLALLKDVSGASQMDVFATVQWFGHQLLLLEMELAERFPKYDSYAGPDRAALANWMEEHGRAGGESPLMKTAIATEGTEEDEQKEKSTTKARRHKGK